MIFILFLSVFLALVNSRNSEIFLEKSQQITTRFCNNLKVNPEKDMTVEISQILKNNYLDQTLKSVTITKLLIKKVLVSKSLLNKGLNKRNLKQESGEIIKEIAKFSHENPKEFKGILDFFNKISNRFFRVKNFKIQKDLIIFPLVFSMGFITTGYVLGIFKQIQEYFSRK